MAGTVADHTNVADMYAQVVRSLCNFIRAILAVRTNQKSWTRAAKIEHMSDDPTPPLMDDETAMMLGLVPDRRTPEHRLLDSIKTAGTSLGYRREPLGDSGGGSAEGQRVDASGGPCPTVARASEGHVHVCELPADHVGHEMNHWHACGDCGVAW